jgi:hypothetical protein
VPAPRKRAINTDVRRPSSAVLVAIAALVGIGAGVGIGAAVWSGGGGGKSSPAVAVAAPNAATTAVKTRPRMPGVPNVGNHAVRGTLHFTGLGTGAKVKLSQGIWSTCTRDENYGTYDAGDDKPVGLYMWVKIDLDEGSCALSAPLNCWRVELPGGGGDLCMQQQLWNLSWQTFASCLNNSGYVWTGGWDCNVDQGPTSGTSEFYISKT